MNVLIRVATVILAGVWFVKQWLTGLLNRWKLYSNESDDCVSIRCCASSQAKATGFFDLALDALRSVEDYLGKFASTEVCIWRAKRFCVSDTYDLLEDTQIFEAKQEGSSGSVVITGGPMKLTNELVSGGCAVRDTIFIEHGSSKKIRREVVYFLIQVRLVSVLHQAGQGQSIGKPDKINLADGIAWYYLLGESKKPAIFVELLRLRGVNAMQKVINWSIVYATAEKRKIHPLEQIVADPSKLMSVREAVRFVLCS